MWYSLTHLGDILTTAIMGGLKNATIGVFQAVALILQAAAALLAGISGTVLTAVINFYVVGMKALVDSMTFIDTSWLALRDVANIFFIFILLYIAIATILNLNNVNTKKMLVNVVLVAIFLNFSLFFTKLIIDVSNLLTISLYNSIIGDSWTIGTLIISKTYLLTFYKANSVADVLTNQYQLLATILGSAFFMFVTAFVLFMISMFFIIRFVVLIFLMILSPLAFAAKALPKDDYSKKWWNALINQCIFAPVFMLFLWITLNAVDELIKIGDLGDVSFADMFNPNKFSTTNIIVEDANKAIMVLLNFVVLITMMVMSLIVSKSLASTGAGGMMKMADSVGKWTRGKVFRGAVRGSQVARLDKKFADSQFGKSIIGRNIRNATTGAVTGLDWGGGSVQKVDKESKKLNEEYAKKVKEDFDSGHLKQYRTTQLNGIDGNSGLIGQQKETREKLDAAKNTLAREAAAGNIINEKDLEKARETLENIKLDHDTTPDRDFSKKADLKKKADDLDKKIKNSEQIHSDISSYTETLEGKKNKKDELVGGLNTKIKEIERQIEDKAGAQAEEAESLRTARLNKAKELDNSWGTGKGIISKIPVLRKLKNEGLKKVLEENIDPGDDSAAAKEFRKPDKNNKKIISDLAKSEGIEIKEDEI
jgi:hypothetical protein